MRNLKHIACLVALALCFSLAPRFAWADPDAPQADEAKVAEQADAGERSTLEPGDSVYVDGAKGSDDNPGTEDAPVMTFARAKQLMDEFDSDIIYVTGTLQVSGTTETWDLGGKTIMRDGAFTGELVHVSNGAGLTLKNIVIDGGNLNGAKGRASVGDGSGGSLIGVFGSGDTKSTLRICAGAKLQNNYILSVGHWMPESGGAVYCDDGIVDVDGGTIANNKAVYGGGICAVYDSVINVIEGSITGNEALEGHASGVSRGYSGVGGGICAWRGAAVNLSGGSIDGNVAYNRGGGISVGGFETFPGDTGSVLTMTGGSVSNNKAGCAGGAIFVQAGLSAEANDGAGTYCVAKVSGGRLVGNQMTNTGDGNSEFGGGAIYVNGYSSQYSSFHNGELYLENAEITGNRAVIAGGGYASCPASHTDVSLTNGSVFYGNETDSGNAKEIYILASNAYGTHSGNPSYEVSPSMLGGGAYRWTHDDGSEVPLDKLKGELDALSSEELSLNNALTADDAGVQKAISLAKVEISGNESETRGGAIGSNGSVFIGATTDATSVSVSKVWDDADNADGKRPESIDVELYRDGEYVGFQTIKAGEDGSWQTTFDDLPKADGNGHEYVYTVRERAVDGYVGTVEGDAQAGYTMTNKRFDAPPSTPETPTTPSTPGTPDKPASQPKKELPQTGDSTPVGLVGALAVAGAAVACTGIVLVLRGRRRG